MAILNGTLDKIIQSERERIYKHLKGTSVLEIELIDIWGYSNIG